MQKTGLFPYCERPCCSPSIRRVLCFSKGKLDQNNSIEVMGKFGVGCGGAFPVIGMEALQLPQLWGEGHPLG